MANIRGNKLGGVTGQLGRRLGLVFRTSSSNNFMAGPVPKTLVTSQLLIQEK